MAGVTEEMRTKEYAHDYRYFPDPDLMPFEPTEQWLAEVSKRVVELPLARKQRFMRDYQLPASDAQTFVWDAPLGNYFERLAKQSKNPKAVANWVINNLRAKLAEATKHSPWERRLAVGFGLPRGRSRKPAATRRSAPRTLLLKFKPEAILELVALVDSGKISSKIAQDVFAEMFATGESPAAIVDKKGLAQVSDAGAIEKFCDDAIAANPGPAADFSAGKAAALIFSRAR